ncbi:hypothetical protein KAK06_18775 [Ideonella sp. 4Y11]|uniref:Uncharacterized protein n=1 Tax=Ideonella aquatica TaxID=2824119 RepID=A0A940YLV7_9BURK|nr:hypothetical protein [Ideonella aquatica]MBQ0961007.1 hypothetical protein [Ideonella aquatica]
MNHWLASACVALIGIGLTHSVMGERRIFTPWQASPPRDVSRAHQVILRASWHLPTLLGLGLAAVLALLAAGGAPALRSAMLAALALAIGACGALVAVATRGRHQGGTAMLATAVLIALGRWQAGVA